MIDKYYNALKEKDVNTIRRILHPNVFGIRVYNENIYYDIDSFIQDIFTLDYSYLDIINIEKQNNYQLVTIRMMKDKLISKILIKDNLIYKVYETKITNKRRIKCVISYDGSAFFGYQKQLNQRTIQGVIEETFERIFNQVITIHSSGRTDKGVHATNQVIHFDISMNIPVVNMRKLLNSYLPKDIYIKEVVEENQTFHSRFDVTKKTYCYKINIKEYLPYNRNYEWYLSTLDISQYKESLSAIVGTHDFTSFTKTTTGSTHRTIYNVEVVHRGDYILTYITGNGFLRYMVRNIIAAAVNISNRKLQYSMEYLLKSKDVTLLKEKAPASGLYLDGVEYN